jgi:signal transduction histidine kinase
MTDRDPLDELSAGPLGDLLAAVAHELGTPLTAILGYAELLQKSAGDEKNRKRAATIVAQVHRLGELTEKLLGLRPPSAGSTSPVRLDGLVDEALQLCRGTLERRGIGLERQFEPAPPVLASPERLRQALVYLLLAAGDGAQRGEALQVALAETERGEVGLRVSCVAPGQQTEQLSLIFPPCSRKGEALDPD